MDETNDTERQQSLSESLATHRDAIYRYILSVVRNPATAEDLTQDTLLRAHRKLTSLDDLTRLVPWLYRIATNLCHDRFRQASYRHESGSLETDTTSESADDVAPTLVDTTPRLDKALEQKEMSSCVQDYLVGLSDSYRAVILLHDTEGLTNPEIAVMLGESLSTIKIRLHRARKKLREALVQACSFSTDERGVIVCDPKPDDSKD